MDDRVKISSELITAFNAFNQDSMLLTESYQRLEKKLDGLTRQLSESNKKRLQELAEKKLLADRLNSIVAALPIGIMTLNTEGSIIEWNIPAEQLLGENLKGKAWSDIVEGVLSQGHLEGGDYILENGRSLHVSIHNINQEGKIVMLHDITEARRLRMQVNSNEKLASIGEMTAGLVHQIRTPLSSAFLYLEKIASEMVDGKISDEVGITALWRLKESLNSINSTVNDLLLFSKDSNNCKENILVSDYLEGIQQNIRMELDQSGAVLTIECNIEDCDININRHAMQGAIHNLVSNALQAGSSRISFILNDIDGQYFELLIRDNGYGMTESEQAKIFSPFFTTKAQGHGLGLFVVKSIIELNGGKIKLLESTRQGSCFSIKFPYGDYLTAPLKSTLTIN